ncbi:MAG: hypothetical protein AB8B73_07890 [Ekhidna sp.]
MQKVHRQLLALLIVFLSVSCSATKESDAVRILFIGNSYTYYNSSPELVKALIQEKFPNRIVETQLVSGGGMALEDHWQEGVALKAITSSEWDYVVLQEQSKLGKPVSIDGVIYFGETDLFFDYARRFHKEIHKTGAETVLFMTWSEQTKPEEQKILTYAYTSIAKELNAKLVPVGLVWDQVRTNKQLNLYARDGSHPSPLGSYLIATTLFSALMDENPVGLSGSLSGKSLSSSGEPSLEEQPLISIAKNDAQIVQSASWEVIRKLKEIGDYPEIAKPKPNYFVPIMHPEESLTMEKVAGRWYGTSDYGFNYIGHILDIDNANGQPNVALSFYSPHQQDVMTVQNAMIENDLLVVSIYDSLRTMSSTIQFSLSQGQMDGLLKSHGNLTNYKRLSLSRSKTQNQLDLAAFDSMMKTFQSEIDERGYVSAALRHYERYSQLVGEEFQPEEAYLNAVGYNLLQDDKVDDALNVFELAMVLYPESINTYDSYGESLVIAGQNEKAMEIYTLGYELALKTNDGNLARIKSSIEKLKAGDSLSRGANTPPPPPPSNQ